MQYSDNSNNDSDNNNKIIKQKRRTLCSNIRIYLMLIMS